MGNTLLVIKSTQSDNSEITTEHSFTSQREVSEMDSGINYPHVAHHRAFGPNMVNSRQIPKSLHKPEQPGQQMSNSPSRSTNVREDMSESARPQVQKMDHFERLI